MWGLHLKQRRGWWYYQRRVPELYRAIDTARAISFALKTKELSEAKLRAAQMSLELEEKWAIAFEQGEVVSDTLQEKRF